MYNRMNKYDKKLEARMDDIMNVIFTNLDMRFMDASLVEKELLDIFKKLKENNYRNGHLDGQNDIKKGKNGKG